MQCPTCHDANACGDYEGPTCDTCGGVGFVAPITKDEMKDRVAGLTHERVLNWMIDRYRNCERIAATKTGADQAGWLEDAMFFYAAIGLIKWSETYEQRRDERLRAAWRERERDREEV